MITGSPVYPRRRQYLTETWHTILKPALDRYQHRLPLYKGQQRSHNLALTLSRHREASLHFLTDPAIPTRNRPCAGCACR